jgi:tubulin polyglutamylase TTLL4
MGGVKTKSTCFEIYGFDILIDKEFRPWLLEVNVSPSLSSSSPMDKYIKTLLLSDSFYITGFYIFDRK